MTNEDRSRPTFSTTLEKGMQVIETLSKHHFHMTNQEIAKYIGISRPTVARLTSTLVELGYLKKNKSKFRLSWRMVPLANPLRREYRSIEAADAAMMRIANEFGGAVSIGTIDRLEFMYLKTVRSRENIWGGPDVGTVGPVLPSSIGWALCSLLPELDLTELITNLKTESPTEWEKNGSKFHEGIASCQSLGSCKSIGALHPDIDAVAVPLLRDKNGDCFAVNFRAPRYMLGVDQIEDEIAPRLRALASNIREGFFSG